MKTGIFFLIQSLLFTLLLIIVYFNKKRLENLDNKIYANLIILSLIELLLELILDLIMPYYNGMISLSTFLAKTYCAVIALWLSLLSMYITIVSLILKNKKQMQEITKKIYKIITIVSIVLIYALPIHFHNQNGEYYTYGNSVNIDYIMSYIYSFVGIICLVWNNKNIKNKKFIPIFLFIVLGGTCGCIQMIYPSLLLSTGVHTFITFLMYFTIENPDMQMVEELNKNRKLTEINFEEKSKFLFKISQDLKKPLEEITNLSNRIIENSDEAKELAKVINNDSRQLYTYVNKSLDISNMDIKNLKIINSTYNVYNFFEEIKLRTKTELKNVKKNIEFRYNISENLPEILSGDNTKLKQIILSVIFDSIKHTKDGFVELSVNSITKYGVCRLIVEISDSGSGIELDKINTILSTTGEITKEELDKIDLQNITLPIAHKIIKSLNGSFIIKSEVNKGTNFLIIVDQKIEEKEKTETDKKLENYTITSKKQIMLISTDKDIVEKTTKLLDQKEIATINSLFGKDALEKLEQKNKYEFILVDDELGEETGIEVLKKIKEKTTSPIIILLNKNNEFLSKHYLDDGFKDFIIKEELEQQIKKCNKYL